MFVVEWCVMVEGRIESTELLALLCTNIQDLARFATLLNYLVSVFHGYTPFTFTPESLDRDSNLLVGFKWF